MERRCAFILCLFVVLPLFVLEGVRAAGEVSAISPVRPSVSGLRDVDLPLPYKGDTVTAAKVNMDAAGGGFDEDDIIIDIEGLGPTTWSVSRWNKGDVAMRIAPRHGFAQSNLGVPPGSSGFSTSDPKHFSAQAWRPHPERGVTLASIAANGGDWNDRNKGVYGVVAASTDSSGYGYSMIDGTFGSEDPSLDINVGAAGPVGESSSDFGVAWFPYSQGWIGGFLAAPSSANAPATWLTAQSKSQSLPSNAAEVVTWRERGAQVKLPGVDPRTDGMLFAIGTDAGRQNSDTNIVSVYPNRKHWVVNVREDAEANPGAVAVLKEWLFSFLYVPFSADGLLGGWVRGADGTLRRSAGMPMVKRLGVGQYQVDPCMRKVSGRDGILLLQVADKEPAVTDVLMARSAFLSYNYTADGRMIVEARRVQHRTGAESEYPLVDTDFYFLWVDFRNPLSPTAASAMSSGPRSNNDGSFGLGFLFGSVVTLLMGSVTWIVLKYVYDRPRGGQSLVALSDFGREDLDTDLLDSAEEYRFQE